MTLFACWQKRSHYISRFVYLSDAVFASANSAVNMNGDIKFYNNSAGGTGGEQRQGI